MTVGLLNVHLATHGILDNRQPLYSHLMLTKTESDSENNGLLEASAIMNMKLNADLAVLSACETFSGTSSLKTRSSTLAPDY